jgi:hypothetical protein
VTYVFFLATLRLLVLAGQLTYLGLTVLFDFTDWLVERTLE